MGNVALGVTTDAADQVVPIESISSNTINTVRKHGLCAGDSVTIKGDADDMADAATGADFDLASGSVEVSEPYYVIASGLTDTAFKLSETLGGSAITIGAVSDFDGIAIPSLVVRGGTTLSASMTDSATEVTVADATQLPAAPFVAIIADVTTGNENVLVTNVSTNTLTISKRGFEGTKASAHASGKTIRARSLAPSACAMADFDALEALFRAAAGKSTNDSHNGRKTTLRSVTQTDAGNRDTLTTGSAHDLVAGDRFIFVTKTGGSNVRLGHTYYVTDVSGGATKIKFCAERLHSSENPYHASAVATANITLADDITSGYIRRLTSGGGTTPTLTVKNSLYPRLWGWGTNVGMLRDRTITATLHLRAVTDRAAQSLIHHTTVTSDADDAGIKHNTHSLVFYRPGDTLFSGTFTIKVDDVTSGTITYDSDEATLRDNIEEALGAAAFAARSGHTGGLSDLKVRARVKKDVKIRLALSTAGTTVTTSAAHNLRVGDRVRFSRLPRTYDGGINADRLYWVVAVPSTTTFRFATSSDGSAVSFSENIPAGNIVKSPRHVRVRITFGNSKKGITATAVVSANGTIGRDDSKQILVPGYASQVADRWARQGAQIALASPAKVPWRPNFEFEKGYFETTAYPKSGSKATDGQQAAWDAMAAGISGTMTREKGTVSWVDQWTTMRTALVTTGGASNVRMVWCPADGAPPPVEAKPPAAQVDFTGWDFYIGDPSDETKTAPAKVNTRLDNNAKGLRKAFSSKSIIVCEFGFGAKASDKGDRGSFMLADADVADISEMIDHIGADGRSEPNEGVRSKPPARVALFRRWLKRIYDTKPAAATPLGYVVAAIYWDRDLGGAADWRLAIDDSLIAAFAAEICSSKTRVSIS